MSELLAHRRLTGCEALEVGRQKVNVLKQTSLDLTKALLLVPADAIIRPD
jgi:hypothetical protein